MTIQTDIIGVLKSARRVLIVSHIFPDFDTIASSLALGLALRGEGKSVVFHNAHGLPPNMAFLPGSEAVVSTLEPSDVFDVTVLLDSGTGDRFGAVLTGDLARLGTRVKIDHHLGGEAIADLDFTDSDRASTGELVHEILSLWPLPINRDIALNIYVAIVTDTGCFRYSNTNPGAFATAGKMLAFGLNAWDVTTLLYENRPLAEVRLLTATLTTLDVSPCGRYASLVVSQEAMRQSGAQEHMTDGFINFARSVQGVEVAMLLHENPTGDRYRVSFRSKGRVNVAAIAASLGGGGHHNAAGCTLDGPLDAARARLYAMVAGILDARDGGDAIG